MNHFADLHIHTYYSDGSQSPSAVVEEACHAGLACIAVTDHDTMSGVPEAMEAGAKWGVEVVAGIELSTEMAGKDIHVLGYFLDLQNMTLQNKLQEFRNTRTSRIAAMIENLKKEGIDNISLEEIQAKVKTDALGRPHLAHELIEKGWAANPGEVFSKYLGDQCAAYVAKHKQSPFEAIELIRQAGGVSVLAHPMITNRDELLGQLVEAGLGGIEVYYPNIPDAVVIYYEGIARKHNLVMTGGSDAHGKYKHNTWIGKRRLPYENVEKLRLRAKRSS